ncbi:hypothetical protein CRUP_037918 [Coryphaenoides rupestris]|nr:hypothetical protein CRUP_037918 [Coryphaenoides rupestris]
MRADKKAQKTVMKKNADDPSPALLNFTSARYIRLVFQRIRTLNADLMTLALNDPRDVDPIVTRRYYYSIKDISVGGMCICYGHAKACPLNEIKKRADECYFNQTVADLSLSLDAAGQRRGGGVCVGCRQDTAGVNSSLLVQVSPEEEEPCQPCSCHPSGSTSQSCVADSSQAKPSTCAFGYRDFPACEPCECSMEGSTNEDPCRTPCVCKENVEGERCDRCKLGFYDLRRDNRRGCEKCSCMGVASQCSASPWNYQNVSHGGNPPNDTRWLRIST